MRSFRLFLLAILLAGAGCQRSDTEIPSEPVPARSAAVEVEIPAPDSITESTFEAVMDYARRERLHQRPLGEIMQAVGERFLGAPYVAGKLDEPEEEILITDLTGFDCVLFIESVLALGRGIAVEDYSYETFAQYIQDQRYRGGTLNGYCSRLHYFSEWIANNEARGTVENITDDLGGERLDKQLTFMSEHRDAYPRFAKNDSLYQGILQMEADLADLEIYYIPQNRIAETYDQLQAGDIIATATDIGGLDVSHSGLVYKGEEGNTGLLHASTSGGVKVSPDLQSFVQNNKIQVGIVVARPTDPRSNR